MDLLQPQFVSYLLRRQLCLSFTAPDVLLPLGQPVLIILIATDETADTSWRYQTIEPEYFTEHDGEEIEFLLQEDRLLSTLSGFRPPATYFLFERLSRFGHKAFTRGADFHLQEIVTVAAISKSWLHECVQATRGHQLLQVHQLIRISVASQLHHEVQDDADRFTGEFSGRVSRYLALGRFKAHITTVSQRLDVSSSSRR